MKAIVKQHKGPGLQLIDVDMPKMESNEVLIKVHKSAICGTDLHIYKWDDFASSIIEPSLTIEHEFVGEIIEVGDNVKNKNLQVGKIVSGEGHITCGVCRNCLSGKAHICPDTKGVGIHVNGAFAEYLTLPEQNVYLIPESLQPEVASILDPLGNAVHTALAFNCTGEDVLITGAGPIGIMAAAIIDTVGSRNTVITDVNQQRLALAKTVCQIAPHSIL